MLTAFLTTLPGCSQQATAPASAIEPPAVVHISEELIAAQERWLLGLSRGKARDDITIPVPASFGDGEHAADMNFFYSLETTHQGKLYQYVQGAYPGTRTLYGLYFEDGLLTALLLDQDVADFHSCEYLFRHGILHAYQPKPEYGYDIEAVNGWVRKRDQIGTGFNARITHAPELDAAEGKATGSASRIEGVAHVPIALLVSPAYGISLLPPINRLIEKAERQRQAKRQEWEDAAATLHPGALTESELLATMGIPAQKFSWQGGAGLSYSWPQDERKLSFGIRNGLVIWKESGFRRAPYNSSTVRNKNACSELRAADG